MSEESTNETEILQSHFEKNILKKQEYTTKYTNSEGKYEEKEQQYFIASFYRDANITDDKDFKERFIKTPCAMKSCPNTRTTFATLFSKNDSGIYPEKTFEYLNPAYTYCGFIYDDFKTAFWSKVDNDNQRILAKLDGKPNEINELCQQGKKRVDIKKMFEKEDEEQDKCSYGESVRPGGKGAPGDYLRRMDYLRHRIEMDVNNKELSLTETNSSSTDKNNSRYEILINNNDEQLTLGVNGNKRYIRGFGGSYNNHIVFNKKTKQIDEKTACNEFVSLSEERVSSLILFLKNIKVEKSFDEKCMNTMLENYATEYKHDKYTEEVANVVSNIKKMLFAQKVLGLPYMPILGGDGKVLCVKLSVVLQALKDTNLYQSKKNDDPPTITNKEIKELQEFEEEKILKLQQQANKQNNIEIKESEEKNKSENKNIKLLTNEKENNKRDNDTKQRIENETQSDKEKDNISSRNYDDMFNNCTNNLRNTWPCSICFGNNN